MIDKKRHTHSGAPKGALPNWALVVGVLLAIALISLARTLT